MLCVLGDSFCDIVATNVGQIPSWGGDYQCNEIKLIAGGSGLNIVVHAASYYDYCQINKSKEFNALFKIHFISCVGNDCQGKICTDRLRCFPIIDSDSLLVKDNARTGSCVVISGNNDRCFITDPGCIRHMSIDWFQENSVLNSTADHYHMAAFYNCHQLATEVANLFQKVSNHILYFS